jgi:anti-sigma regulatory factor (Ser/Thr protein kinase)
MTSKVLGELVSLRDVDLPAAGDPVTRQMPATPGEVGPARRWFRACLQHWPDTATADAVAVFSEIAGNAARHTNGTVRVAVWVTSAEVLCGVRDGSWRAPRRPQLWRPGEEAGRGLQIVEELAHTWGWRRHWHGKTVWFVVLAAPAGLT